MAPAIISAIISFVMYYIVFTETMVQIPTFVEKFCIFAMATFLAWVTITLIRIGFRDFFLEIIPGVEGIDFRQINRSFSIRWEDIKLAHESASTLSITTNDKRMVSISADLTNYETLKDIIISKTGVGNPFRKG